MHFPRLTPLLLGLALGASMAASAGMFPDNCLATPTPEHRLYDLGPPLGFKDVCHQLGNPCKTTKDCKRAKPKDCASIADGKKVSPIGLGGLCVNGFCLALATTAGKYFGLRSNASSRYAAA